MSQEDNDDATRIGLWVTLGVITLLIFGILGGLVLRQMHKLTVAPATPAAVVAVEEVVLIEGPLAGDLVATLYFETAQAALPAGAAAELDKLVQAMAAAPARKLVISGFHDSTGDPALNAELARQRALSVRSALLGAGIDKARVALRKPEVTTGSGTEQEARRVEMRLVD